jgi:hypothetical protein
MTSEELITKEIEAIDAAISGILAGGQSWEMNSGGASRRVTFADYDRLVKRRDELAARLAAANGELGTRGTFGW